MRYLYLIFCLILLVSCAEQDDFTIENFPDFENEIKSDSLFADLILRRRPTYVTDPIFDFKDNYINGNLDEQGLVVRDRIKKEFGKIAWNQILEFENKLVVYILYSTTNSLELTAVLYVDTNEKPNKYRLIGTDQILNSKKDGLTNLYDLGYYSYFKCKVPLNKECAEEQIYIDARNNYLSLNL